MSLPRLLTLATLSLLAGTATARPRSAMQVTAGAAVLYVDDDAPAGGDGAGWDTAFRHLQDALATADALGGAVEIRVAQGEYRADLDEAGLVEPGDRNASFVLADTRTLLGGFAGIGAADPDVRDPALYVATLSGDLVGDDEPGLVGMEENTRQVVRVATSAVVRLDGLTVVAGNADEIDGRDQGAAIIMEAFASLTLTDCTVVRCRTLAGGAVQNPHTGPIEMIDCTLAEHATVDGSGAALNVAYGDTTLLRCTVSGNTGRATAGIDVADLLVEQSVFDGNVSHGEYSGVFGAAVTANAIVARQCVFTRNVGADADAGAIGAAGSDVTVEDCAFEGNQGVESGALHVRNVRGSGERVVVVRSHFIGNAGILGGGAVSTDSVADLLVEDCRFEDNAAHRGGALALDDTSAVVQAGVFVGNRAASEPPAPSYRGGALHVSGASTVTVRRARFLGNTAVSDGGAVAVLSSSAARLEQCFLSGNSAASAGGAVYEQVSADLRLEGCTIVANAATITGGVYSAGSLNLIRHCIAWDNVDAGGQTAAAQVSPLTTTQRNCIQGYDGPLDAIIADDPRFVGAAGPDGEVGTADDDPHLEPGSPCANRGLTSYVPPTGTTDIDGEPRRAFCAVDLGADELQGVGADCNANGNPDRCDVIEGESPDCNGNGTPDECDVAAGTSEDCNDNGVPDECDEIDAAYLVDDGTGDTLVVTGGWDVVWLNAFEVTRGNERLGAIQVVWGPDPAPVAPATVLVYADPDDDGNPDDAELLLAQAVEALPGAMDEYAVIPILPQFVGAAGEWFFIGVHVHGATDEALIVVDDDDPYQAATWFAAASAGAIDLEHLGENPVPPTLVGTFGSAWEVDLCVRGVIHNPCACEEDVDESGAVDVGDLLAVLSAWGACDACAADIDGSGTVDVGDLLAVLSAWGQC